MPFDFTGVNAGSAWVLDDAAAAASVVTHVRAIPADGAYGASVMVNAIPYTSLIKDYALVFEAGPSSPFRVSVCAARTLNATGQSRVTLSLR